MELSDEIQSSNKHTDQQVDIHSYPLPIRIKHPSWSVRKGTYQQVLYYLKNISSSNQQILISGTVYTIETLLPYFQNLVQQKHASVLLKGLQCVQQILLLERKFSSKHCIKTLVDKGIEYFPLLSQQKKAILQKFLDILELCKIQSSFLKNKLNLPHQKSVMYVIEVIGVLNVTSLKSVLVNLSKKHQKKCVRQLAAQIAQQLEPTTSEANDKLEDSYQKQKPKASSKPGVGENAIKSQSSKLTIQKLPHYQQLPSKKQQEYSNQLVQKIDFIIEEYSLSQLPSFSHVLRLMIDDNNHIVNVNAIKCMIKIFLSERADSINKNTLLPQSFPLLFIFNKFKSHKTHPINSLLLSLAQAILQSSSNRVNDLLLAINEGLNSAGSKANVKFGCALTFFRAISLIHQNEDLYACTTNENIENQNQDLTQKFTLFSRIKFTKNQLKTIQKIMSNLEKDKKYETQIYLIKYAIGLEINNLVDQGLMKQLQTANKSSTARQYESSKTINKNHETLKMKKSQVSLQGNRKSDNIKIKGQISEKSLGLGKTLKVSKSSQKFLQINLQESLKGIIRCVNEGDKRPQVKNMKNLKGLLQKSSEQFYSCVRERRYEMFYLCELLQGFIESYQPNEETIECVSEYLVSLLKIISLLKPVSLESVQSRHINKNNVCQLLLVALCRLAISEEIQQVLQNLNTNYGYETIYESLQSLFVIDKGNKIKKKNKKYLLQWLESNTPAMFLNSEYYKLLECINDKKEEKQKQISNTQNKDVKKNQYSQQKRQRNDTIKQKQQKISPLKQPKLKQTSPQNNVKKLSLSPKNNFQQISQKNYLQQLSSRNNFQPLSYRNNLQLKSSRKRQNPNFYELQNINLSKIQNNNTESNYYDEDYMQKSSFHQNLQQQLKQIKTYRSYEQQNFISQKIDENNVSKEYLKNIKVDNFKKKQNYLNNNILQSPFKQKQEKYPYGKKFQEQQQDYYQQQNKSYDDKEEQADQQERQLEQLRRQNERVGDNKEKSIENRMKQIQQSEYVKKFVQVEMRRLQRERQRREFMERMKFQYRPIMKKSQEDDNNQVQKSQEQDQHNQQQSFYQNKTNNKSQLNQSQQQNQQQQYQYQLKEINLQQNSHQQQYSKQQYVKKQKLNDNPQHQPNNHSIQAQNQLEDSSQYQYQYQQPSKQQEKSPYFNQSKPIQIIKSTPVNSQISPKIQQKPHKNSQSTPDSSFISTTSTGDFKYKLLNHQKVTYMLKSTTNPYPHLRTLILIPFKSSPKKHQFLQQLLYFFTNQVQFKMPQPYTALTLLTILMFSEIKEDKSLIQPLQSLYELVAKQSTTNEFLRTIISLFHTVIEETLVGNRRFLITILLKSMIRMLPFIEDGVGLLRDIQQFYQIGEMVYFEMFEQEYGQIRKCLQEDGIQMIVQKGLQQEGENLKAIVEGWLNTRWKSKVLQTMEIFQTQHSHLQNQHQQHQQQQQNYQHDHPQDQKQQPHNNYQSYI